MTTCPHCGRDVDGVSPDSAFNAVLREQKRHYDETFSAFDAVREALRAGRSDNLKLPEGDQKP